MDLKIKIKFGCFKSKVNNIENKGYEKFIRVSSIKWLRLIVRKWF